MAITRAQQAKQMLKQGGRTGFFTAGLAAGDDISPGTSTSGVGSGKGRQDAESQYGADSYGSYDSSKNTSDRGGNNNSNVVDEVALTGGSTAKENYISEQYNQPKSTSNSFDYETEDTGEYGTEVALLKIDRGGTEKTILSRVSKEGAIALGADDTVAILAGDTKSVIKANHNFVNENVVFASEGGFLAFGFPGNDTTWSNRNVFQFKSDS